eukprot:4023497-Prymnesium_polylepis.1
MEQPSDETQTAPPGVPPLTRARQRPRRPLPQRQPSQNSPGRMPTTPSLHAVGRADAVGRPAPATRPRRWRRRRLPRG